MFSLFNSNKKNKDENEDVQIPEEEAPVQEEAYDDDEEDEYYEEDSQPEVKQPKTSWPHYPHEYLDPCDIYIGQKSGAEEYYFNVEKTLRLHHLGWLWKILPFNLKEKIEDWAWDKDFLHNISIKQHEKAERLNSLPASGQLAHDITQLFIKGGIIIGLIAIIWGYNYFIATPNEIFNLGMSYLNNKQYPEAKAEFVLLDTKKNANIYVGLCNAQIALAEGKYDDAYSIYEKLEPYAASINLNNINELKKECMYQKAINYYSKGEWQNAIDTLIPIIKYSNAVEYYEKCQYKIADISYEAEDYYKALEDFFPIANYDDVQDRMNSIMSNIYAQGLEKYHAKDYMGAAEIFNSIVQYDYLDCRQMSTQCFYQSAQDLFDEEQYSEAKTLFEQIPEYKDSQTMIKECVYKSLYSDDYSKNILNMLALDGYRDVSDILQTAPYNLYAEWLVSDINGKAANNETFIFNIDGDFVCSEPSLPAVAVSDDEIQYNYIWDDEMQCFSTADNKFQIYIEGYDIISYTSGDYAYITLRCVSNGREYVYRCQKINELSEYYETTLIANTAETTDYELIQTYLDSLGIKNDEPSVTEIEINPNDPDAEEMDALDASDVPEVSEPVVTETTEEDSQIKTKTFACTVTRVYDDSILVVPDSEYNEADIAERFIVLYDHSSDLEEGDEISVMYKTDINMEVEPYEIEAYKVKYLGSSSEPTGTTVPEESPDEAAETEDDGNSGFSF